MNWINWKEWNDIAEITGAYKSTLGLGEETTLTEEERKRINNQIQTAAIAIRNVQATMNVARVRYRSNS
jgi:hypothetical protein